MKNFFNFSLESFLNFNRKQWLIFQNTIVPTFTYTDLINLKKINNISMNEIIKIYLPLSKFLNLHIESNTNHYNNNTLQNLYNIKTKNTPYIIGISGSVAVGKSTIAKILQILLSKYSKNRIVELVKTDGFLYPNQKLKKKNLIRKKGFPQSYDTKSLINFMLKIKSGCHFTSVPVYSHIKYDIINNVQQIVVKPDILILEGLNILQTKNFYHKNYQLFISHLIDFYIYIDAPENLLHKWYIKRFLKFFYNTFSNPNSYFNRYKKLSISEIITIASKLWININSLNLKEHILPTRKYANLILNKNSNHVIEKIQLRKE